MRSQSQNRPGFIHFLPLMFGLVAAAVFATGIFLQLSENRARAERAEAFLQGPPAVADTDEFDPARHVGMGGEVVITVQLDIDAAAPLPAVTEGGPTALYVPIYAADALDPDLADPFGAAIFTAPNFTDGRVSADSLRDTATEFGAIGPVVYLNGRYGGMESWAPSLERIGVEPTALRHVIYPFVDGRRVALLPSEIVQPTIFGQMSKIAGCFGLLALAGLALKGRREDDDPSEAGQGAVDDTDNLDTLRLDLADAPDKDRPRSPVRGIMLALFSLLMALVIGHLAMPVLFDGVTSQLGGTEQLSSLAAEVRMGLRVLWLAARDIWVGAIALRPTDMIIVGLAALVLMLLIVKLVIRIARGGDDGSHQAA
ncbi:hypothetical protein [Pelagovum pacificum]|uniref:Uncharacterized protein n=1 Tax=Pelagovum pacificum TaxID=2588711 RepID=A0A5C5GH84_9RHOB|nr:hypothetical protein [Pelagovum pacificum]QQA43415.1 hypothetical protein I8N54_02240 [Pelagovum pacificum]TNY33447.1 hypothetical protein FHY64_09290 [Pelagovum pacificum]